MLDNPLNRHRSNLLELALVKPQVLSEPFTPSIGGVSIAAGESPDSVTGQPSTSRRPSAASPVCRSPSSSGHSSRAKTVEVTGPDPAVGAAAALLAELTGG